MDRPTVIVAAKVPPMMAEELTTAAEENDRTLSAEIRRALRAWLENGESPAAGALAEKRRASGEPDHGSG